jgi:hypothetical protein
MSHLAEYAFEEEQRLPKVLPPLGDASSGVKLVFAGLIRVSERWGQQQFRVCAQGVEKLNCSRSSGG